MPPEEIQLKFTGTTGINTLRQAFDFYLLIKSYLAKSNIELEKIKVLDFGVGWGRIIRFFTKDIVKDHLFGVDVLPDIIELCSQLIKNAIFYTIDPLPPLKEFSNESLDLIYAYSVFSHLNEDSTSAWFEEFNRILKKGGLLVVTTRSRSFINYCASIEAVTSYQKILKQSFTDNDGELLNAYDNGYFVYVPIGGGGILTKDFYGESCIPELYFENKFSHLYYIESFIENFPSEPTQSVAILRKKHNIT